MNRWWTYQRERFPVVANGVLICVFSVAAVFYSHALRDAPGFPHWQAALVAFINSFCAFLQLRLADEFKDVEEDSRYRPYRPVPRGLVTLRELAVVWVVSGVVQLAAALWFEPRLVMWLIVQWTYLALMSREFFCREWLKARPLTYLWSHMLIMPIIDFYATACDWLPTVGAAPQGLAWFVAASFFNGIVIEIGRKIRIPKDEEPGVPTYTRDWGRGRAGFAWLLALALAGICGAGAALIANASVLTLALPIAGLLIALLLVRRFAAATATGAGKRFEVFSAVWTLLLYLWLGSSGRF